MSIIQSRSILGSQGLSPTLTPVDRAEGLPVLTEIEAQRTARLEALMLLATDQTIEAARRWHGIAWTFHKWADGTVPTTSEAVESEYAAAQVAREAYYGAVREELAVHLDTP